MASRPFFPKMPTRVWTDNPRARMLPAAGFGILARLVLHFWETECRPLPIDHDELFSVARAHRPTWKGWREEILAIFAEIAPALAADFRQQVGRRNGMLAMGLKGASVMKHFRAQQAAARKAAAPSAPTRPIVSESARRPKAAPNGFTEAV